MTQGLPGFYPPPQAAALVAPPSDDGAWTGIYIVGGGVAALAALFAAFVYGNAKDHEEIREEVEDVSGRLLTYQQRHAQEHAVAPSFVPSMPPAISQARLSAVPSQAALSQAALAQAALSRLSAMPTQVAASLPYASTLPFVAAPPQSPVSVYVQSGPMAPSSTMPSAVYPSTPAAPPSSGTRSTIPAHLESAITKTMARRSSAPGSTLRSAGA